MGDTNPHGIGPRTLAGGACALAAGSAGAILSWTGLLVAWPGLGPLAAAAFWAISFSALGGAGGCLSAARGAGGGAGKPNTGTTGSALDWAVREGALLDQDLRRAEAMFESLSAASGHGMFICRSDGTMAKSNAKFSQMAAGAARLEEMAEPGSRAELRAIFNAASSDLARCKWEGWGGEKPGGRRIALALVPLETPSGDGSPGMYVGHVQDVSDVRRLMDRLAFERDKASRVMEAVNDAVMFLDAYGHVERASMGMLAMLGKKGPEVEGLWVGRVVRLASRVDGAEVAIEEMLMEEGVDSDGWSVERAGGGRSPVELRWRRLRGESFEGVLSLRDISKRVEEIDGIKWEAEHDALTGLMNRRSFQHAMEAALDGACLMIDLDGFKEVNDRHGHDAGDEALKWAAASILGASEPGDFVARLGGDEFAVLMPGADSVQGGERARRIEAAMSGSELVVDGAVVRMGASVGVSELADADAHAADALKRADEAMYRRKQERRRERSGGA